jgi:protoporphyrinogen oxidase
VIGVQVESGRATGVVTKDGVRSARAVIATPPLPIVADLLEPHVSGAYRDRLRRIRYLANVCLVLELDRSLSSTYWLNVNDPGFPFVGVIEHTNFEPESTYGGRHIIYLSKYLPESDDLFKMDDPQLVKYSLASLRRMFPSLADDWVLQAHVWRARYSQPIVERGYSKLIPPIETPIDSLYLASMAQVYPEDRGTNYAIREGVRVAEQAASDFGKETSAPAPDLPLGAVAE